MGIIPFHGQQFGPAQRALISRMQADWIMTDR
jgi:hypothetical protein